MGTVATVRDAGRASLLMHPLRRRVLEVAREPGSASDFARQLGLPRQKVNYHVRALARAGFLEPVDERRKQNVIEKRYVATARSYVLLPQVLGSLGAGVSDEDAASATHLLALAARAQSEVAGAVEAAAQRGDRVSTLALDAELRFESAAQRAAFAAALSAAVVDVVGRFSAPARPKSGRRGRARRYRLVVACHPIPEAVDDASTGREEV